MILDDLMQDLTRGSLIEAHGEKWIVVYCLAPTLYFVCRTDAKLLSEAVPLYLIKTESKPIMLEASR